MTNREQILKAVSEWTAKLKLKQPEKATARVAAERASGTQIMPGANYVELLTLTPEGVVFTDQMAIIGEHLDNKYFAAVNVAYGGGDYLRINAYCSGTTKKCYVYNYGQQYICELDFSSGKADVPLFDTGDLFFIVPDMNCDGTIEFYPSDTQIVTVTPPKVVEIYISNPPTKTVYQIGESFDRKGMSVKARYDNGEVKEISGYTVLPSGPLALSDTYVTIYYEGAQTTLEIKVDDHPFKGVFITGFEGEFVKITKVNGKPVPEIAPEVIEVELPGDFDVEVDLDGYMTKHNLTLDQLEALSLGIYGKVYVGSLQAYACDPYSNATLCPVRCVGNNYYVPIKKIYDMTGSANFKFYIENPAQQYDKSTPEYLDNYPHEIIDIERANFTFDYGQLVGLRVKNPPNKQRYLDGQKIDTTGLKVEGIYEFGAVKELSSYQYNVTPREELSASDNKITIRSTINSACFIDYPIEVYGQYIGGLLGFGIIGKRFSSQKEADGWSGWTEYDGDKSEEVYKDDQLEIKTVIAMEKSLINTGKKKQTGIKIAIKRKDYSYLAHIKVNGIEQTLPEGEEKCFLYIGNVEKGETGALQAELEYADKNLDFEIIPSTIYFCSPLDPTMQGQKKDFPLVGGVNLSVNVFNGENTFAFNDLTAEQNLLGINIAHIFNSKDDGLQFGKNFRLNLYERIELSKSSSAPIATPVYTDARGQKHNFTVRYYGYFDGKKQYLNANAVRQIRAYSNGKLYLEQPVQDGKVIKYDIEYEYLRVQGWEYLPKPDAALTQNIHYKDFFARVENTFDEPLNWLKNGNTYKCFDTFGDLVFTLEGNDKFIILYYDKNGNVDYVKGRNNNIIKFVYNDKYLIETRYGSKIIKYSYRGGYLYRINYYYGNQYEQEFVKGIEFSYRTITVDGVKVNTIYQILSSEGAKTSITYDTYSGYESRIKSLTHYTQKPSADGAGAYEKQSCITFEYDFGVLTTKIKDDDENGEVYVFNNDGLTEAYYQIYNNLVSQAVYYDYTPFEKQEQIVVANEFLNKYTWEQYNGISKLFFKDLNFKCNLHTSSNEQQNRLTCLDCKQNCVKNCAKNCKILTELNDKNLPVKVQQTNIPVTDNSNKTVITEYGYNNEMQITSEVVTEKYSESKIFKQLKNYNYNSKTGSIYKTRVHCYHKGNGNLDEIELTKEEVINKQKNEVDDSYDYYIEKKSYFIGEVYDLDKCFYAKSEYNRNGQAINACDELNKNLVRYWYYASNDLISRQQQPDGSEIRFTYDSDDRLSKIRSTSSDTENANTIVYDSGEVKKLNHSGNCEIEYIYDNKRRPATIKIGGIVFETYEYEENVMSDEKYADRMTVINAKGERFCVEAEKYGMFEKAYYNDGLILEREYDNNGRLKRETDYLTNTDKSYVYDSLGNVIKYISGGNEERITYNYRGEISEIKYIGEVERSDKFTYKDYAIDYITAVETGMYKVNPLRDVTGRYTGKSVNIGNLEVDSESVEYRTSEKYLTHIPEKIIYKDTTLTYGYDVNGNISEISKNGELQTRYKYDSIGRLIREDNKVLNTSTTYKYDNNGNIVERKRGVYTLENEIPEVTTDTYIYFPNGRLQSYNGASMSYERTYNPTIYLGKTMSWTRGRKLSLYNGTSFEYDGMGRRIKKNDIEYSYDCNGRLIKQSDGLEYYYDTTGLLGFSYNDRNYVYRKDIQGNIIGILDNIGRVVVEYNYDAWGRHTVSGSNVALGNKNPFRYRGYYYDTETELYYLQSRYYDPKLCRFINMDSIEYAEPERINGLNLFAYCGNNPVMFVDPSGHWFFTVLIICAVVGAAIGGTISGVEAAKNGGSALEVTAAVITGGAIGGTIGLGAGLIGGGGAALISAGAGMIGSGLGMAAIAGGGAVIAGGGAVILGAGAVVAGSAILAGSVVGSIALANVLFSKWIPDTWPGDDPTVPPGDGFEWRGPGEVGSDRGAWYNPETCDSLHPDLHHPKGIAPHWDYINRLLKICKRLFK